MNMKKGNILLIAAASVAAVAVAAVAVVNIAGWQRGEGTLPVSRTASVSGENLHAATLSEPDRQTEHKLGGSVKNLTKTGLDPDKLELSWEGSFGIDEYYVYLCDVKKGEGFKLAATVSEPHVTLEGLSVATAYDVKVTTCIEREGAVAVQPAEVLHTATRPKPISDLEKVHAAKELEFKWKRNKNCDGYKIYRSVDGGASELVKTIDKNKTVSYKDKTTEAGKRYTYSVCTFRSLEGEDYESERKSIDFVCGLCAPENLSASIEKTDITLSWKKNAHATGYRVFRSTKGDEDYELLGTTDQTKYTDEKLKRGTKYYYRVEPIKTFDNGDVVKGTGAKCVSRIPTESELKAKVSSKANIASGTYIEVSIDQQHMWFYENNQLVLDTDVVTGNYGSNNTPRGRYTITSRATNTTLTGPGYSSFVNYWMGFYGGYGIHDSSWRSSYGGSIYRGNGSHGCVNTPYSKVKQIYERTTYGTPVIVY